MTKSEEYAVIILNQIQEMFSDDCENHIDLEDLQEGNNATHFIHALATIVPNMVYNKLTGDNKNHLQFNHMANQLVFQNISLKKDK